VALSEHPPNPATDSSKSPNNPIHPLQCRVALITRFPKRVHSSALTKGRELTQKIRMLGMNAFQPIGIVSILILTAITIGPPWDSNARTLPISICMVFGIIFGVLLWKIPRERYSAIFANIFGWLPVTLGTVSYPFWYWYAKNQEIGGEFFHAAADILPVLLLATVIDVRRTNELEGKQLVPPIAAVFLGELASLNALAFSDSDMTANFAATSSSLVVATFALVIAVMADLGTSNVDMRDRNSAIEHKRNKKDTAYSPLVDSDHEVHPTSND
jgi:hypothetical protein